MSADLVIDLDACHDGASKTGELAEELDQAASTIKSEVQDQVGVLDGFTVATVHEAGQASFRLHLRDHRRALLFTDLAQYIETNAVLVEEADAAASADMEHLEGETVSMSAEVYDQVAHSGGEYTASEYYALTGAEHPTSTGQDGAIPTADGDAAV